LKNPFEATWHLGLLYKLLELDLPVRSIKLFGSFLLQRKFIVSVEGEVSAPNDIQAGVAQGSVLFLTL
jgi:hypothetical protein